VRMDLLHPASVARAVCDGLVGIGSFVAPFAPALDRLEIVHVAPSRTAAPSPESTPLAYEPQPVSTPWGLGTQPRLVRARSREPDIAYTVVPSLSGLTALRPGAPVLLDVDMDYFCSRDQMNGDGSGELGVSLAAVEREIDEFGRILAASPSIARRVAVITVALSPGFYPAAYWRATVGRLCDALTLACGGNGRGHAA